MTRCAGLDEEDLEEGWTKVTYKNEFKLQPKSARHIKRSNAYASLPAFLAPLDPPNKSVTAPLVPSKHDPLYRLQVARWR